MKDKYIEERFPRWFVFGKCSVDGTVDVSDGEKDVATRVTPVRAELLIDARDSFVDRMIDIFKGG